MAESESLFLSGPAGRLEAVLTLPAAPPAAAAVVCHAHPLHGGMMHFKPLFRTAKALQSAGLAALRFNFRGVGASEGVHDFGQGEQDDARAALDELERRFPGTPLLAAGFSFGSTVALRLAAREPRVSAVLALGYPLRLESEVRLDTIHQPLHFVQGERDEFGSGEALRSLLAALPRQPGLSVVAGADHYFTERLDALFDAVVSWARLQPWRGHVAVGDASGA